MRQFDTVKQDRGPRRKTDRADRSDASFQMIAPEILHLLPVTIESRSCDGAVAIIAEPWGHCDDAALPGEAA
jgi:hypothetical protein